MNNFETPSKTSPKNPSVFRTEPDWKFIAILNTFSSIVLFAYIQTQQPYLLYLLPFWSLGVAATLHFTVMAPLLKKLFDKIKK